jgi:large subunit ribosomal protein L13
MIIDGKDCVLGRIASFAAKKALQGETIEIVNCKTVIISGSKKDIERFFEEKRGRVGSGQKGPKPIKRSDRMVKLAIRGMLPNYREGRGREAFRRIKCYLGVPKELEEKKKIVVAKENKKKFSRVEEFSR